MEEKEVIKKLETYMPILEVPESLSKESIYDSLESIVVLNKVNYSKRWKTVLTTAALVVLALFAVMRFSLQSNSNKQYDITNSKESTTSSGNAQDYYLGEAVEESIDEFDEGAVFESKIDNVAESPTYSIASQENQVYKEYSKPYPASIELHMGETSIIESIGNESQICYYRNGDEIDLDLVSELSVDVDELADTYSLIVCGKEPGFIRMCIISGSEEYYIQITILEACD